MLLSLLSVGLTIRWPQQPVVATTTPAPHRQIPSADIGSRRLIFFTDGSSRPSPTGDAETAAAASHLCRYHGEEVRSIYSPPRVARRTGAIIAASLAPRVVGGLAVQQSLLLDEVDGWLSADMLRSDLCQDEVRAAAAVARRRALAVRDALLLHTRPGSASVIITNHWLTRFVLAEALGHDDVFGVTLPDRSLSVLDFTEEAADVPFVLTSGYKPPPLVFSMCGPPLHDDRDFGL